MKLSNKFKQLPRHVAIIMDGNRRWAEERGLSPMEGHRAGLKSLQAIVNHLANHNLEYLTAYGFSTENWNRSKEEVNSLLKLLQEALITETPEMHKKGLRLRHIGRIDELPLKAQQMLRQAMELTKSNTGMTFSLAFNYGARVEILDAVRQLMAAKINPIELKEDTFKRFLYTDGLPDVDLLIRTGGETRLSNFLLWQSAYSELYFTDVLWPDFNAREMDKALSYYSHRQRRFGGD